MLRTRAISGRPVPASSAANNDNDLSYRSTAPKSTKQSLFILFQRYGVTILMVLSAFTMGMVVQNHFHAIQYGDAVLEPLTILRVPAPPIQKKQTTATTTEATFSSLPLAFHGLANRAMVHQHHCQSIGLDDHEDHTGKNNHTAHLQQFGILDAIQNYDPANHNNDNYPYQCQLPPENECGETQFTVIFMAYNPERLRKMYNQVFKMVNDPEFAPLVAEVLIVWNGERHVDETPMGKALVDLGRTKPVRISYPLKEGFSNDLMNRYHPRLAIQTKAIMYYDDDGPFYSYKATLGGFELWKRNANAQIGAMARKLDLGKRQAQEKKALLNGPGDRFFISQCPTDNLFYNFNEFANFGANMVLPSGSFLHSNYLCFLWHPLFDDIRQYVRQHPVNPDDGTVSVLVSQLGGRAPKVYSRRINESKDKEEDETQRRQRRRLLLLDDEVVDLELIHEEEEEDEQLEHRRLMDGIDWDRSKGGQGAKKNMWGKLRSDAANSLIRYFGSINSGSIGWCYGTPYQNGEYCQPEMAKAGQLPWLKNDHTARDVCP